MLIQYLSKLRPHSKDGPNILSDSTVQRISRKLIGITPILSIFAFLGMITYATLLTTIGEANEKAYADSYAIPTSALIISNPNTSTETVRGQVSYSSHNVRVQASDIGGYALTITGPTNLTNGSTTIGSAGTNVAGSSIADNKWGYAWGDTSATNANMKYNGFTGSAQSLDNNTTIALSNNAVDFTKKLVFAVKFNQDAASGHYKAGVTLNLTLTPRQLATTWDGLVYMQDMTADICTSAPSGAPKTVKDSRDGNSYTIQKLADGNCWMTENLRLANKTISAVNSDMASGSFDVPASEAKFSNTQTNGTYENNQVYYNNNTSYGAYYSWCTATAGSCMTNATTAVAANTNAASSICPKGWHLPVSGTKGVNDGSNNNVAATLNDFAAMAGLTTTSYTPVTGDYLSFDSSGALVVNLNNTTSTWPAAGEVSTTGPNFSGSSGWGKYWSRTAKSVTNAYYFYFYGGFIGAAQDSARYNGYSVRCIAYAAQNTTENVFLVLFDKGSSEASTVSNMPNPTYCRSSGSTCIITLPITDPIPNNGNGSCSIFVGWSKTRKVYDYGTTADFGAGDSVTIDGDTTFYATWKHSSSCS